jgi:hypothetical protein
MRHQDFGRKTISSNYNLIPEIYTALWFISDQHVEEKERRRKKTHGLHPEVEIYVFVGATGICKVLRQELFVVQVRIILAL